MAESPISTPSPPNSPLSPPPAPKRRNAGDGNDEPRKKSKQRREYIFFEIRKPSPIHFDDEDEGTASGENNYEYYLPTVDERPLKYLDVELKNIDDLIQVGMDYYDGKYDDSYRYNINVFTLSKLVEPLKDLKKMIGMTNVKNDIFQLLLYQLQEFDNSKDMLHTIIEGEPGVGKTELAKILGKIYREMGYCKNDIIKFVKRADLIGGYLGQTAIKTQKVLDSCKGGILIIDEAYSLGNSEGRDSYSKECLDTLCSFLSESPDTIVFMMGYKEAMQECLFNHNKGLERRFTYRFTIEKYEPEELKHILFKIVRNEGWDIENEDEIEASFFEKNREYFKYNGGDMLNLFTKCKFTHSIRYFNMNRKANDDDNFEHLKKKLNFEDIQNGFKLLLQDENFASRKNDINDNFYNPNMYS